MKGSGYCFLHNPDPEVSKKRADAVRRGGSRTADKAQKYGMYLPLTLPQDIEVKTAEDVRALLSAVSYTHLRAHET